MRIGGDRLVDVDVRVIAATNRSLEKAINTGKFRGDLLYRLRVFPIHLPRLSERGDDIDLLIQHFTRQLNMIEGREKRFTPTALEKLRAHPWPGNIRELINVVYRSYFMAEEAIEPKHLPADIIPTAEPSFDPSLQMTVGDSIAKVERYLILATLDKFLGDKKTFAEVLGISIKTPYNRLNEYN